MKLERVGSKSWLLNKKFLIAQSDETGLWSWQHNRDAENFAEGFKYKNSAVDDCHAKFYQCTKCDTDLHWSSPGPRRCGYCESTEDKIIGGVK